MEDRLLTRHNKAWLPQIEKMLKEPKIAMVVVGAGHLTGPNGLVELLKQKGFKMKQW
ncbi:MAG: TraB/GumN family protein [bacterium]|nr:TraB/GumN family protein [bacterium]